MYYQIKLHKFRNEQIIFVPSQFNLKSLAFIMSSSDHTTLNDFNYVPTTLSHNYIPRRKSGIYWIQVRRAAAAVEISLWTR